MNSGNNESLKNQLTDYVCATSRAVLVHSQTVLDGREKGGAEYN